MILLHTQMYTQSVNTHRNGLPGFLKRPVHKEESLDELGFEFIQSGQIPQTGRQRIPDSCSDKSERVLHDQTNSNYVLEFTNASCLGIGGCVHGV